MDEDDITKLAGEHTDFVENAAVTTAWTHETGDFHSGAEGGGGGSGEEGDILEDSEQNRLISDKITYIFSLRSTNDIERALEEIPSELLFEALTKSNDGNKLIHHFCKCMSSEKIFHKIFSLIGEEKIFDLVMTKDNMGSTVLHKLAPRTFTNGRLILDIIDELSESQIIEALSCEDDASFTPISNIILSIIDGEIDYFILSQQCQLLLWKLAERIPQYYLPELLTARSPGGKNIMGDIITTCAPYIIKRILSLMPAEMRTSVLITPYATGGSVLEDAREQTRYCSYEIKSLLQSMVPGVELGVRMIHMEEPDQYWRSLVALARNEWNAYNNYESRILRAINPDDLFYILTKPYESGTPFRCVLHTTHLLKYALELLPKDQLMEALLIGGDDSVLYHAASTQEIIDILKILPSKELTRILTMENSRGQNIIEIAASTIACFADGTPIVTEVMKILSEEKISEVLTKKDDLGRTMLHRLSVCDKVLSAEANIIYNILEAIPDKSMIEQLLTEKDNRGMTPLSELLFRDSNKFAEVLSKIPNSRSLENILLSEVNIKSYGLDMPNDSYPFFIVIAMKNWYIASSTLRKLSADEIFRLCTTIYNDSGSTILSDIDSLLSAEDETGPVHNVIKLIKTLSPELSSSFE